MAAVTDGVLYRYIGLALAISGTMAIGMAILLLLNISRSNHTYLYRNKFCHYEEGIAIASPQAFPQQDPRY